MVSFSAPKTKQPDRSRVAFRIKFDQPCRVVGPDWIMSPGEFRSQSRGAILLPCEASYEGLLTLDELQDDLALRLSRRLGLLSLRDRVRDVRQGRGPEEEDAAGLEG